MPSTIKRGSMVLIVEGPFIGQKGIVTQVQRVFNEDAQVMRWTVWLDNLDGGEKVKTRLSWVREI